MRPRRWVLETVLALSPLALLAIVQIYSIKLWERDAGAIVVAGHLFLVAIRILAAAHRMHHADCDPARARGPEQLGSIPEES
jgi:hypothetical protein